MAEASTGKPQLIIGDSTSQMNANSTTAAVAFVPSADQKHPALLNPASNQTLLPSSRERARHDDTDTDHDGDDRDDIKLKISIPSDHHDADDAHIHQLSPFGTEDLHSTSSSSRRARTRKRGKIPWKVFCFALFLTVVGIVCISLGFYSIHNGGETLAFFLVGGISLIPGIYQLFVVIQHWLVGGQRQGFQHLAEYDE